MFLFSQHVSLQHVALEAEFTLILTVMCSGFGVKHRPSCQILMRLDFTRQTFQNQEKFKFHENSSKGRQNVYCWRTARETEK